MEVKLQKGFTLDGKKITPMAIMNYFEAIWLQADSYFNETILPDWQRNDDMYRDKFDLPEKQQWQQHVVIPVVDQLVTRITQFFTRTLVNTYEQFYTVQMDDKQKQQAYTELLRAVLRDNKFAADVFPRALNFSWLNALFITKTHFINETESYPILNEESGELEYTEEVKSRVAIEVVEPKNIRLDPSGDQYIIEVVRKVPLDSFIEMGRTNGWTNVDKIKHEALYGTTTTNDIDTIDQARSNHLPVIDLYYVYTKSLTDEKGVQVCKDVCFIIANREYVVDLKYNTGVNGSTPYTVHNPMMDVYGRYGRPYISKLRSLIKQYMNAVNLAMDAGVLAALGTHEINTDLLPPHMAHSVTADINPGRQVAKKGEGKLFESSYPPNGAMQAVLQLAYFFDQAIQNHSYQSEFFTGQPTAKGRPTLGEVQLKTQQNNTFFTDIATQIENHSLQPTCEKALYTYLLHMDDDNLKDLSVNISDETVRGYLLGIPYAERLQDIRQMQIEVKGMSGKIQLQNNFSKVMQLLGVLGNFGVNNTLIVSKLVEKGFEVVDDTPDEFFDMDLLRQLMNNAEPPAEQSPSPAGVNSAQTAGMEQPPGSAMPKQMADKAASGV